MKIYLKKDLLNVIYEFEGELYPFGNADSDLLPVETPETITMYCRMPKSRVEGLVWDEYNEVSPEELTEIIKDMQ